jgi:hypothetical protein
MLLKPLFPKITARTTELLFKCNGAENMRMRRRKITRKIEE